MLKLTAAILKLFYDRAEISVTEVTRLLAIPKSTASRHLKEMALAELLEQDAASRRYRPGPVFLAVQQQHRSGLSLVDEAIEELRPLLDRFGHTCFVMGRTGTSLTLLATLEGTGPIRVHATPRLMGGIAFFRSPGRALLARLADDEIRELYPAGLRSTSSHSPATVEELIGRLAIVRRQGFAEVTDEGFPSVSGISVAVAPPDQPAIALNICFVAGLLPPEERKAIADALRDAGSRLGRRFGDAVWSQDSSGRPLAQISSI